MAITIKIEPQEIQSIYNEIIVVLESTQSAQTKFEYLVDVVIGGTNGTTQASPKIENNPDGYGVIDLHKFLEPFVSYDIIDPTTTGTEIELIPNSYTPYQITLSEQYVPNSEYLTIINNSGFAEISFTDDPGFILADVITISNDSTGNYNGDHTISQDGGGVYTLTTAFAGTNSSAGSALLTSNDVRIFPSATVFSEMKYAFNGVLNWDEVSGFDFDVYNSTSGQLSELLTSITSFTDVAPTTFFGAYELTQDSRMYLNFSNYGNSDIDYVLITSYDANGNYINDVQSDDAPIAGVEESRFFRIDCGPWNVNNSGLGSGYGTDFLVGASFYTVQVFDLFGEGSKIYRFKIVEDCQKFEVYQFLFLDRLGSMIPISFNLLSRKTVNINKKSYNKNHGSYNSVTNSWGYNSWDRGKTRLDTTVNEQLIVNSNWVNEDMSAIIDEMYASSEVYHINENGKMLAINLLKNNYKPNKRINDQIFNHTFNFEYSFKNAQQR